MANCESCGRPLGSNPECEQCRRYLTEMGAQDMDEEKARRAAEEIDDWAEGRGKSAPFELIRKVVELGAMVRDWFAGRYRKAPWRTIAMAGFAVLYAINVFDLVPDFIPVAGWLDDLGILGAVTLAIQGDLTDYKRWRAGQGEP